MFCYNNFIPVTLYLCLCTLSSAENNLNTQMCSCTEPCNQPRKAALTCFQAMLTRSSKSLLRIYYQKEKEPASYYHKDFVTLPCILSHRRCLSSGNRNLIFSFMSVLYCKRENCFKYLVVLLAVAEIQLMSSQPMFML